MLLILGTNLDVQVPIDLDRSIFVFRTPNRSLFRGLVSLFEGLLSSSFGSLVLFEFALRFRVLQFLRPD